MNILVAEDEKDIRRLIKIALEERGYTLYEAKDGVEALQILERENIDMAILDVIMPRLDGFNLIREIRKTSHIPVMFLTARGSEMDRVLGLGLGADDYLVKPFSLAELIARVEAALRRNNAYNRVNIQYNTVVCDELKMDLKACLLYKGDKEIVLNAKEYKLLKFLMKNPNTVFTKRRLYENVWEEEYCYDDNTIMVTLSRLRNKIEDDVKNPKYIITVKGLGYKLQKDGMSGEKK